MDLQARPRRKVKRTTHQALLIKILLEKYMKDQMWFYKHLTMPHVAKLWRETFQEQFACVYLQRQDWISRLYLSRERDWLAVEGNPGGEVNGEIRLIACLDSYKLIMNVNTGSLRLDNEMTPLEPISLPMPNTRTESDGYFLLYDTVYKVVHVSRVRVRRNTPAPEVLVRAEMVEIRDGVCGEWNTIAVPVGFQGWEWFLVEGVIIKNKYLFWDVRSQDYVVRLNVENGEFRKVFLPVAAAGWLMINHETSNIRYLFEDRCELLFFYCSNEAGTRVLKLDNNDLTWHQGVVIEHEENWTRNRQGLEPFTFVANTVFLGRYLLFKKRAEDDNEIWYYDLVNMVTRKLIDCEITQKGITWYHTYQG